MKIGDFEIPEEEFIKESLVMFRPNCIGLNASRFYPKFEECIFADGMLQLIDSLPVMNFQDAFEELFDEYP